MKPADIAWITLAAGIIAYEAAAATRKDWELLSEAADRHRHRHPVITHMTVTYVAAHLLRRWPSKADPLHQFAKRIGR